MHNQLSPLTYASMNGHIAVMNLLLEHGAEVDKCYGTLETTTLSYAVGVHLLAEGFSHIHLSLKRQAIWLILPMR
jgi:ankyrin repeat protein